MSKKIFIDTNVLVDIVTARKQPHVIYSQELFPYNFVFHEYESNCQAFFKGCYEWHFLMKGFNICVFVLTFIIFNVTVYNCKYTHYH